LILKRYFRKDITEIPTDLISYPSLIVEEEGPQFAVTLFYLDKKERIAGLAIRILDVCEILINHKEFKDIELIKPGVYRRKR